MSDYLLLGPVLFQDFEVPAQIGFGGAQRLAVHVLPGGARVIDAMGRDDADIVWSGAFSGPDGADRARLLDLLRAEGGVLPLAWDAFCYLVVIARFEANYQHVNWVPYRLVCKVVQDQTQAAVALAVSLATGLASDLAAAGSVASAALAAVAASGATAAGSAAYAAATGSVAAAAAQIAAGMAVAGSSLLAAGDPASAAAAAGSLASLADAQGYVGRAQANLVNAGA